ncbi:hypothetical protein ACWV27_26120 (plasmid) [Massilia varians]
MDFKRLAAPIYGALVEACKRIVCTDGSIAVVEVKETNYVLDGRTISVRTQEGEFPFWVGVNGPRLFFIAYISGADAETAKREFAFCFGGAAKVGWEMNYEPIDDGVSIWATCMTDRALPLVEEDPKISMDYAPKVTLTAEGAFWVNDIAMMVQSWVRTCERRNIRRHEKEPAPL